jgi:hydrogenase nickel incorporation protein HypA/HybF
MHETSLFKGLLNQLSTIAAENGASRVTGVKVRIGALSNITADHFREHFEDASIGTLAEGAQLDVEENGDVMDANAMHMVIESVELDVAT